MTEAKRPTRAPRTGRGGTVGNLNAAGPRGRALAVLRKGLLHPRDRWVSSAMEKYVEARASELTNGGGVADLSRGQLAVLQTSAVAQAVVAIILSASAEGDGLIYKDADGVQALTSAGRELPKFLRSILAAEQALGVKPATATEADAFTLVNPKPVPAERVK